LLLIAPLPCTEEKHVTHDVRFDINNCDQLKGNFYFNAVPTSPNSTHIMKFQFCSRRTKGWKMCRTQNCLQNVKTWSHFYNCCV